MINNITIDHALRIIAINKKSMIDLYSNLGNEFLPVYTIERTQFCIDANNLINHLMDY
jgi:hypothetical protein